MDKVLFIDITEDISKEDVSHEDHKAFYLVKTRGGPK